MLGGVHHGLAGGLHQWPGVAVQVAIAHHHDVDVDPVSVFDLGRGRHQRRLDRGRVDRGLAVQPRPQFALLSPGQGGHRLRVLRLPLNQGKGLQHRVVQVGGHVGARVGEHLLFANGGQ